MGLKLSQTVEIKIVNTNKKYYEDLGYVIPTVNGRVKRGTAITVDVLDLSNGSHADVEVDCDCCNKEYKMPYKAYLRNKKKSNRTWCNDCSIKEIASRKRDYISNNGKWYNKEYALSQLKKYIEQYGTLAGISCRNTEGQRIVTSLRVHKYNINELCKELGYDYLSLKEQKYEDGYLNDFDNLKNITLSFIEQYGFFPTIKDYKNELHVPSSIIKRHGGIIEIKNRILGDDAELLEDDTGFINRSHYEYIVAQFLNHNKILYTREQYPFPEPYDKYRSDFTLYSSNGDIYHVELWGYYKNDTSSSLTKSYNKKRKIKTELYSKYHINLLSIDAEIFKVDLNSIQEKLLELFQPLFLIGLKHVDIEYLRNPNKYSDQELLDAAMKHSTSDGVLPTRELLSSKQPSIVNEILKRYKNYNNFAKKFNMQTSLKKGMWTKEFTLELMKYMHDTYGYLIPGATLKQTQLHKQDKRLIGLCNGMEQVWGSIIEGYLYYYNLVIENNEPLSDKDIEYLKNLKSAKFFGKAATVERRQKAVFLLDNYYQKGV